MKPDQEIARAAKLEPIENIAKRYGINRDELELYGDVKAKVKLSIVDRLSSRPNGKYIDITAISPTPLGEGKTTNTIGVTMGLTHIGKKAACVIRQASLGPVFGIKGGAAGGGQAQVIPPEDLNIHLTGDIHAVQAANNLACAFLDNHLFNGNELGIDVDTINLRRGMDINDRDLRNIITGLRNGLGYGWRALIAAEMIVGTSGIGFMMFDARRAGSVTEIVLGMILLGILWYIVDAWILAPIKRRPGAQT